MSCNIVALCLLLGVEMYWKSSFLLHKSMCHSSGHGSLVSFNKLTSHHLAFHIFL